MDNYLFFNDELISKIELLSNNFNFDKEEDIVFKSVLLTLSILTKDNNICNKYIESIATEINNNNNYNNIIRLIINDLFKNKENDYDLANQYINNYFKEGFSFHTFNGALFDSINNNGLKIDEKPWENNELQIIKDIFSKHKITDIFGIYSFNKKIKTPLYVAHSLNSSAFYGYSSPTWFRHFCTGGLYYNKRGSYDRFAFYDRDYDGVLNNINKVMKDYNFNDDEKEQVLSFLNKYWEYLGKDIKPMVALVKNSSLSLFNEISIKPDDNELAVNYFNRIFQFFGGQNHTINKDINREDIKIFNYNNKDINKHKNR